MPRITPLALRTTPNLARLLPAVRDIASARNELRWLRDHVDGSPPRNHARARRRLTALCSQRGRGVPLQYLLGTQPFGDLDVRCQPGVLIPRPETEAYTVHLARLLRSGRLLGGGRGRALRVVDFCTGTGCIPLLLASLLAPAFPELHVHGVDISPAALSLSRLNLRAALATSQIPPPSPSQSVAFHHGDLLSAPWLERVLPDLIPKCDVLVSNPPYVSPQTWRFGRGELSYSTRKFEPKLALVPRDVPDLPRGCWQEDIFYAALLDAAGVLGPTIVLFEFGDVAQGKRILELALRHPFCQDAEFEFWKDCPDLESLADNGADTETEVHVKDQAGLDRVVPIRGSGNVRSIVIRRPATRTV